MRRVRRRVSIIMDIEEATVKVIVDGIKVSKAEFLFDKTQIMVTDVDTKEKYQRSGYGRLLFNALKLLSEQKKMPLILWSVKDAVPFYESVGMLHLNDPEVQERIEFGNVERTEIDRKVDEEDFVYIPQSLNRRKPIIYL